MQRFKDLNGHLKRLVNYDFCDSTPVAEFIFSTGFNAPNLGPTSVVVKFFCFIQFKRSAIFAWIIDWHRFRVEAGATLFIGRFKMPPGNCRGITLPRAAFGLFDLSSDCTSSFALKHFEIQT